MVLLGKAKEEFNIKPVTSAPTEALVNRCVNIYNGTPDWLEDGVRTVNFAESVCSEVARLTTLGIHLAVDGSDIQGSRAEYIDKQINKVFYRLREWVEYGCAYGTIILKPSNDEVQVVTPEDFVITETKNGKILGVVFHDCEQSPDGKKWYNRLEYHRFLENGLYAVDNKCYVGSSRNDAGTPLPIEKSPWNGLLEHVEIENIEKPLFGVLRTPSANNKEVNSPLGMPIFSKAIEELKDLDVAYSRNNEEIYDSRRTLLIDADRLTVGDGKAANDPNAWERRKQQLKLPRYASIVGGSANDTDYYHEINPTLNTSARLEGINSLLSQIGFKCGFSNGAFVFNEKTGVITATQVEADQQRTIQLIKDVRDKLEDALTDLCDALSKFADLYDYAPVGTYELKFDFGDITYSYEEDKATWWNYVQQGKMPAWKYFVKFEGMTEEEAKELLLEAQTNNAEAQQLFASVRNE